LKERVLFEPFEDAEAVVGGQAQIKEDQLNGTGASNPQGIFPVARADQLEIILFDGLGQELVHLLVVIDQQDSMWRVVHTFGRRSGGA
jgi:hypothetical protein